MGAILSPESGCRNRMADSSVSEAPATAHSMAEFAQGLLVVGQAASSMVEAPPQAASGGETKDKASSSSHKGSKAKKDPKSGDKNKHKRAFPKAP